MTLVASKKGSAKVPSTGKKKSSSSSLPSSGDSSSKSSSSSGGGDTSKTTTTTTRSSSYETATPSSKSKNINSSQLSPGPGGEPKPDGSNSRFGNPFVNDQPKVIRLPGGPRDGFGCPCPPPPWCRPPPPWCSMPPCPPPWGCPPPPQWGGCPPPWGFPPPPPVPGRPPCFPPPFSPVCDFPPGGKQMFRVPRGCPPRPMFACGESGAQPCYNNCNFYTSANDTPNANKPPCPYPYDSYGPPLPGLPPPGAMLDGAMRGGRFPMGLMPRGGSGGGASGGFGSTEDFFKDMNELVSSPCSGFPHVRNLPATFPQQGASKATAANKNVKDSSSSYTSSGSTSESTSKSKSTSSSSDSSDSKSKKK